MRVLMMMVVVVSLTACSGVEYKDTNAAVDANPLCASAPDRPGEPVSKECERERAATWNSEGKSGEPVDFSGKQK